MRLAGLFAGVGLLVCLLLITIWKAGNAIGLNHVDEAVSGMALVLWPASLLLMALHAGSNTSDVILLYAVLILVNAILYGLVGLTIGALMRFARHTK